MHLKLFESSTAGLLQFLFRSGGSKRTKTFCSHERKVIILLRNMNERQARLEALLQYRRKSTRLFVDYI